MHPECDLRLCAALLQREPVAIKSSNKQSGGYGQITRPPIASMRLMALGGPPPLAPFECHAIVK